MHHGHLLSLLVIVFVSTWTEVTAIEGNTTPLQRQQHGHRLLPNDDFADKTNIVYRYGDQENEERANAMPSMSNFKDLPGKSINFIKKVTNLRKDSDIVTTMEKNTVVKNMATALEKNPSSLKQLVHDPNTIKSSASLDKKIGRFQKADISILRQIFAKDPVKANKFDVGIKIIGNAMTGVVAVGMATLLILALLAVVSATK